MDRLIDRYALESFSERRATFRQLVNLVVPHAFAEELVLFPLARQALNRRGEAITSDIERKHQGVNELLKSMEQWSPGDPDFEVRASELFALLRSDAREEEIWLLPALAHRLGPASLRRLGSAWVTARRAAPVRAHPRLSRRPPLNLIGGLPLLMVDRVRAVSAHLRNAAQ